MTDWLVTGVTELGGEVQRGTIPGERPPHVGDRIPLAHGGDWFVITALHFDPPQDGDDD